MPILSAVKRPFFWALALLIVSAGVCGYTIYRLEASERWLHHTYDVQLAIAAIERNVTRASRSRMAYVESGDPRHLQDLADVRASLEQQLADLREVVSDNPEQAAHCDSLRAVIHERLQVIQRSVDLQQSGKSDVAAQARFTAESLRLSSDTASTADAMQQAEDLLLRQRSSVAANFFTLTVAVVLVTFALSALLFWISDRMLGRQLGERQAAERSAQLLSTALMRAQDEERRKFSRELHDSLGQALAAAKMLADSIAPKRPDEPGLVQLSALLDDALKETRSLSQLLHPPLLDEVGFLSAASWFVEEFSQRTGIHVDFTHPPELAGLPKSVELTLFRILQEALTNVHRHSKSSTAAVELSERSKRVTLSVRDNGIGIPQEKLRRFQANGSGVGVGLAGMRNRVREQGGTLSITSSDSGTMIVAEVPTDYALNAPSARQAVARAADA
jgi:signal transduction histidine kinase